MLGAVETGCGFHPDENGMDGVAAISYIAWMAMPITYADMEDPRKVELSFDPHI